MVNEEGVAGGGAVLALFGLLCAVALPVREVIAHLIPNLTTDKVFWLGIIAIPFGITLFVIGVRSWKKSS